MTFTRLIAWLRDDPPELGEGQYRASLQRFARLEPQIKPAPLPEVRRQKALSESHAKLKLLKRA